MSAISGEIFQEIDFLTSSLLLGAFLIFCYDWLRIFRRLVCHGTGWISLEDFCYWTAVAFAVFALLYEKNNGRIRWYALAGVAVGMLAYNSLASPFLVKIVAGFLQKILRFLGRLFHLFYDPVEKMFRTCVQKTLKLKYKIRKLIKNLKRRLKIMQKEIRIHIIR